MADDIKEYDDSKKFNDKKIEVKDSLADGTPVTLKFNNQTDYRKFVELGDKMRKLARRLYPANYK